MKARQALGALIDPMQDVEVGRTSERTGVSPGWIKFALPMLLGAGVIGSVVAKRLARKAASEATEGAGKFLSKEALDEYTGKANEQLSQIARNESYGIHPSLNANLSLERAVELDGQAPYPREAGPQPFPDLQPFSDQGPFTLDDMQRIAQATGEQRQAAPLLQRLLGVGNSPGAQQAAPTDKYFSPITKNFRSPDVVKANLDKYRKLVQQFGMMDQDKIISDAVRNDLWIPNTMTPMFAKDATTDAAMGSVGAITSPSYNSIAYDHLHSAGGKTIGKRRYLRTSDIPMWDFDLPSASHVDPQILNRNAGDAIEAIRKSGTGAGTVYRTPGGLRYIDTSLRGTPAAMKYADAIPERVDPFFSNLIKYPLSMDFSVPRGLEGAMNEYALDLNKDKLMAEIQQARKYGAFEDVDLLQASLPMSPGYSARMTPKVRPNDYVAQPIMDIEGAKPLVQSQRIKEQMHDTHLARMLKIQPLREQFANDVAGDLPSMDKATQAKIREYMFKKHGIALSLAAMLGLPAAGSQMKGS
jgi:hypothetical protein